MLRFLDEFTDSENFAIRQEFQRLGNNVYLDHAGTTLYSEKQIDTSLQVLKKSLFCNPHTCKITGDLVDQVRYRILSHFNTDATKYSVIFTSNATAALKIVAECFDFKNDSQKSGNFYYCQENHTSILGMREVIKTDNHYVLTTEELLKNLSHRKENKNDKKLTTVNVNSLVVFSAQCNFSGFKIPLQTIDNIHQYGLYSKGTMVKGEESLETPEDFYICLDTASYAATNYLNLSLYQPDFCCLSFYKMFGYPSGVGALLVSKRGQKVLNKVYYGGGTVKIAMPRQNFHVKRDFLTERFEDGTLPFLSIVSLLEGFHTIERLIPSTKDLHSWDRISIHVFQLAKYCHDLLSDLVHINGNPLVKFYNHDGYHNLKKQGGIVTFNILHDVGTYVGFAEVACIASLFNINLRTGCFCNPGACQWFLGLTDKDIKSHYNAGHICSDYNDLVDGVPTGAVRVSFGYMTTSQDIDKLVRVIQDCYLTSSVERLRMLNVGSLPEHLQSIPSRLQTRLISMSIFPVKSCGSFKIHGAWPIDKTGLKYDRCWMIIDTHNMVVTQKHDTRLCLIKPYLNIEDVYLELNFEKMNPIRIPLDGHKTVKKAASSTLCQSKVCSDLVEGVDCGDDVAEWLSECLQKSVRLVRQSTERKTVSGENSNISLANQAQFLLINKTSVSWLSSKIESEKESLENCIDRFRANFLIQTAEPLDENNYENVSIGSVHFKVEGFCTRCQMICIDQHTGQKTAEPLKTIARVFKGKIRFGIYLSLNVNTLSGVCIADTDKITVERKPKNLLVEK